MRALLDAGADPDIRTGELSGLTPLELAARQPEGPQAMALLLEYGDRPDVVSGSGLEPLLHHAAVGHPDTVTMLLDRGAQAHQRDRFGRSALFKAAAAGNAATARRLLLRAADPNWSKYDGPAVLSGEGERPLHVAVHFPEVMKLLLEHGADPDRRMPFTGTTPLHLAAGSCEAASLALLLARSPDPNARDEHGDTPLTHAVRRVANAGTVEWETWRKSCETDTSWEDPERCIAVNRREYVRKYEPREECAEIVSTLMRHGARTDIPGYDGHPPLKQAWLMGLEDEALRWFPVRDTPRSAHPSPEHRLQGDLHLPHPPRRIARGRRRPHRSRHPHPTLRLRAEPGEAVTVPSLYKSLIGFKQARLLTRRHPVEDQLPRLLQAPENPRHRRTVQIGAPNLQRSIRRDLRCRQNVCADEAHDCRVADAGVLGGLAQRHDVGVEVCDIGRRDGAS